MHEPLALLLDPSLLSGLDNKLVALANFVLGIAIVTAVGYFVNAFIRSRAARIEHEQSTDRRLDKHKDEIRYTQRQTKVEPFHQDDDL